MPLLAMSERESTLCLIAQLNAMCAGALGARLLARRRETAWAFAFFGAAGAMIALILTDGQGAFLLLLYTFPIYWVGVVGRRDLP